MQPLILEIYVLNIIINHGHFQMEILVYKGNTILKYTFNPSKSILKCVFFLAL